MKAQKEKQKKLEIERSQKAAAQVIVSKPQTIPVQPVSAPTIQAVKTPVQTVPISKPANSTLLGGLTSKPSFGISIPTTVTPISFAQNATVEKTQSQQPSPLTKLLTSSGPGIAKEAEKPTQQPFGTTTFANTSSSSGFSIAGKTEATSNFPSFANLSTNKQTSFGNITVTKLPTLTEPSTETKSTAFAFGPTIAGSNEPKSVSTSSFGFASTKEGPVVTSATSFSFNLGTTSTPSHPTIPVTATNIVTTQSTGFKFDTLNTNISFTASPVLTSNSKPIEKSTPSNATTTPINSGASIKTTTSSIGSFSFSLGGDNVASTVTTTKPTVTTAPQVVTISTPSTVSSSIGTTTTSVSSG